VGGWVPIGDCLVGGGGGGAILLAMNALSSELAGGQSVSVGACGLAGMWPRAGNTPIA